MTKFEIAWMVIFGLAVTALMVSEHIFNGLIVLPLIPLIGKGIGAMLKC